MFRDLDLLHVIERHSSAVRSTPHEQHPFKSLLCNLVSRAKATTMMALPWDDLEGFEPPSSATADDRFDEDLFSAALLFLDHQDSSSDSDSYSTHTTETESRKRSQQLGELAWETLEEKENCYDRSLLHVRLKVPRTSYASSPFQAGSISTGSTEAPSSVWSGGEPNAGAPVWSPSEAPTPATPRRVNKRRQEINLLRTEVHVLQARLDALLVQPPVDDHDDSEPAISAALGAAWQSVANRQLEQRKQAESENCRLKDLVNEHKRTAKTLKRLVARHVNAKTWDPFRAPPPLPDLPPERALALEDPGIFDTLLTSLEPMLQQADSILANITASSTPTIKNERHDNSHLTVRYVNSRVVPFGKAETTAAVWSYMLTHNEPKLIEWTQIGETTFKGQFTTYSRQADCEGHAKGKLVLRRVDGSQQTVFIRSAMFQRLTTHTKNRFLTVPMRHFQWTVIDQPASLGYQPGRDTICRIVTCSVSIPRLDIGDLSDPSRAAEIDDLEEICSQISMQHWDEANKTIDNLILDNRSMTAHSKVATATKPSDF